MTDEKAKKLNKGEWSEIYAVLMLICSGVIYQIERNERVSRKVIYVNIDGSKYWPTNDKLLKIDKNNGQSYTVDISSWGNRLTSAWTCISNGKKSFECPIITSMAQEINISRLKASSNKKDDLLMWVEGEDRERGYSVKSAIAARPSILNASNQTHLIYNISSDIPTDVLNSIVVSNKRGLKDMLTKLSLGSISFNSFRSAVWQGNLGFYDKMFPQVCLNYFLSSGCSFESIVRDLGEREVSGFNLNKWLKHSKSFLHEVTYETVPGKEKEEDEELECDKKYSGGMLIVGFNGSLQYRSWRDCGDNNKYLLKNAEVDTPSQSRHDFGYIYCMGEYPSSTFTKRHNILIPKLKGLTGEERKTTQIERQIIVDKKKRLAECRRIANNKTHNSLQLLLSDLDDISGIKLDLKNDRLVTLVRNTFSNKWEDKWVCEEILKPDYRYINLVAGIRLNDTEVIAEVEPSIMKEVNNEIEENEIEENEE